MLSFVWCRVDACTACDTANPQDSQDVEPASTAAAPIGAATEVCATDVVRVDLRRLCDERNLLLERFFLRLREEGLELCDVPDPSESDFLILLAELGFDRVLDRVKLRKALREWIAHAEPAAAVGFPVSPAGAGRAGVALEDGPAAEQELALTGEAAAASKGLPRCAEGATEGGDADSDADSDFVPAPGAYHNGEHVEYYSRSLRCWLPGQVLVEPRTRSCEEAVHHVHLLYDGQRRQDVGLEALRRPIGPGEPCEVFSPEADRWLPAVAGGDYHGSRHASDLPVSLLDACGGLDGGEERVPKARVRRRFPPGYHVRAYLGPDLGWLNGVVAAAPSLEGGACGAEAAQVVTSVRSSAKRPASPERREDGKAEPLQAPLMADGSELTWWAPVSVCMDEGGRCLIIPSYAIRFRQEFLVGASMHHKAATSSSSFGGAASSSGAHPSAAGSSPGEKDESFVTAPSDSDAAAAAAAKAAEPSTKSGTTETPAGAAEKASAGSRTSSSSPRRRRGWTSR